MRALLTLLLVTTLALEARAEGDADKKATRAWRATCATCHGLTGRAENEQGRRMGLPDMASAEWQKGITDDRIRERIRLGVVDPAGNGVRDMPAFEGVLKADVIEALVKVVRGHGSAPGK